MVECLSDGGGSLRHLRLSPSVGVRLVVPSFFAVITRSNQLTCLVPCPALELTMDRTPSPVSPRLMKTPQRATLSPKGARASESTLPSLPWGRGVGGEGVRAIRHCQIKRDTALARRSRAHPEESLPFGHNDPQPVDLP
jgi:hypothetical protein